MADQWVLDRINSSPAPKPVAPVVPKPQVAPQTPQVPQPAPSGVSKVLGDVAQSTPVRMAGAGLGKIADALSRLNQGAGTALQRSYETSVKNKGEGFSTLPENIGAMGKGFVEGFTNKSKTTPGSYLTDTFLKGQGMEVKNPYVRAGVQLATDIVADPLNVVGGLPAKLVGKGFKAVEPALQAVSKLKPVEKAINFAKTTPAIYKPIEAVSPYWRNPEAGKLIERTKEAIRIRVSTLYQMVDEAGKGLKPAEKARVGQLLEGGISTAATEPRLVEIANKFRQLGEEIGRESVKTGLLSPESFEKLKGNYMHHMWDIVTDPGAAKKFGYNAADIAIDKGPFMKRKGAEGYVREFMAPTFKGLGTEIKSNEAARLFQQLGSRFGRTPIGPEDTSQLAQQGYKFVENLAESKGGKVLNKTILPQEIIDYVNRYQGTAKSDLGKAFDAAMNLWKQGKTVWNPAYHIRNLLSNQILSELQTGRGIPLTLIDYVNVTRKYLGKGDQKYFNEAKNIGLIKTPNFGVAIKEMLGQGFEKKSFFQRMIASPSKLQTFMEETAKLNVYSAMRNKGMGAREALNAAEEAIFSPYKIQAAERSVMGRALPFYSFTRQAAPFIGKKLATHPERFTKYIKGERAVESLTEPENEDVLPEYMQNMVRTPFENKQGQRKYFNPQYIYPWGNFFNESKSSVAKLPFGFGLNPILEEINAQRMNKDPYFGNEIAAPGDPDAGKKRVEHAVRTFAPNLYNVAREKVIPALQGKPDTQGRQRDLGDIALGEGAGIKLYPFNVQSGMKSKNYQRYIIGKEAADFIKKTQKRRQKGEITAEEMKDLIKRTQEKRKKRLSELQ